MLLNANSFIVVFLPYANSFVRNDARTVCCVGNWRGEPVRHRVGRHVLGIKSKVSTLHASDGSSLIKADPTKIRSFDRKETGRPTAFEPG